MPNVEFYRGSSSNLSSATKTDGAFYYTTNDHKLYACDGSTITQVGTTVTTYTVTVSTSWTSNSDGGYYKDITVTGITAADAPIADVVLDSTVNNNKSYLDAWYHVGKIETKANAIRLYAYDSMPSVEFKIKLVVIK